MQRPLLHLNWVLEQEWLQPASSLLSPQSLSGGEGKKGRVEDWVSRATFSVTPAWPARPLVPTHSPPPHHHGEKQQTEKSQKLHRPQHAPWPTGGEGGGVGGLQEAPPLSLRKLRVGGYPFQQVWEQGLLPSGGLGRGSSVLGEKGGWSVGESVV